MTEYTKLQLDILKRVFVIFTVLMSICWFFQWNGFGSGILMGALIGALLFRLLALSVFRSTAMNLNRVKAYTFSRYIVRYAIMGIILYISYSHYGYSGFWGCALGLYLVRLAIMWKYLIPYPAKI